MDDLAYIEKRYRSFSVQELLNFSNNPKGLRKDAAEILIQILKERNINEINIENIRLWATDFSETELQILNRKIKQTSCSNCFLRKKIVGISICSLVSDFISYNVQNNKLIICTTCARQFKIKSLFKTLLLGWWSKKGLFLTPLILISKIGNGLIPRKIENDVFENFYNEKKGDLWNVLQNKKEINVVILDYNNLENEQLLYH